MQLAPVIEFAPCCIICGRMGPDCGERNRKPIMTFAALANLVAMVLCIIAAISGLSSDPSIMESIPWVTGEGSTCNLKDMEGCEHVKISMSIVSRYDEAVCKAGHARTNALLMIGFE